MAKSREDYVAQGRKDYVNGLSEYSSGVPRAGWQLMAWKQGWQDACDDAAAPKVEVTKMATRMFASPRKKAGDVITRMRRLTETIRAKHQRAAMRQERVSAS
jgi:hypothetical protein